MATLDWCKKQKKGITITEPNENLCKEYLQSAEETLSILKDLNGKSNMWLATTKYYCEYFTIYALLMKLGVKSEIHECTITICQILEHEHILPKNTAKILEDDKELRIDNQYYLKNKNVPLDFTKITEFILTIKNIINTLTYDKIKEIRKKLI